MNKTFLAFLLAFLALIGMGLTMFFSVQNDSVTSDEPPHLLSGYVALKYGNDYVDPEHPLFAKTIAAAPLLFENIKFNMTQKDYIDLKQTFDVGKMFDISREFLNYQGNNPDQILLSSRIPMIFLTLLFGVFLFFLAKKLFGDLAAIIATFLYATEPLFLAHGRLINTDVPGTGFFILTLLALLFYSNKQSTRNLIFLTVSLSLAMLSKYSTVILLPVVLLSMEFIYRGQKFRPRQHLAYLFVAVIALISLFYGLVSFRDRGLAGFIPIQYFKGLIQIQYEISTDKRFSYLLGESFFGSKWYYFPVMILAKTQILTLMLFAASLPLIVWKLLPVSRKQLMLVLFPAAIFLGLAVLSKFNIGVRHVMPIYPVMIILASGAVVFLINFLGGKFRKELAIVLATILISAIGVGRIWSVVTTHPGYLSYYNFIFGGTVNGWKVADDSNYDWGQDVKRLADYVKANNIQSLGLDNYTGKYAAKGYYKLPIVSFSPKDKNFKGYAAVSTSVLVYHEDRENNYSWLIDHHTPVARAGYSIFIYKLP